MRCKCSQLSPGGRLSGSGKSPGVIGGVFWSMCVPVSACETSGSFRFVGFSAGGPHLPASSRARRPSPITPNTANAMPVRIRQAHYSIPPARLIAPTSRPPNAPSRHGSRRTKSFIGEGRASWCVQALKRCPSIPYPKNQCKPGKHGHFSWQRPLLRGNGKPRNIRHAVGKSGQAGPVCSDTP